MRTKTAAVGGLGASNAALPPRSAVRLRLTGSHSFTMRLCLGLRPKARHLLEPTAEPTLEHTKAPGL